MNKSKNKLKFLIGGTLIILAAFLLSGAGSGSSQGDGTPLEMFYDQIQLVGELTAVPDEMFTEMGNRGLSGDSDFESTVQFDNDTGLYAIYSCSAATSPWNRKFEVFVSANSSFPTNNTTKALECVWTSNKNNLSYTVKIDKFAPSDVSAGAIIQVDVTKSTTELAEVRMKNLGGNAPNAIYVKLSRDTNTNEYDVSSIISFPGTFSETALRNNSFLTKGKVTSAGYARIGLLVKANSANSATITDNSLLDPDLLLTPTIIPSGATNSFYADATTVSYSPLGNAASENIGNGITPYVPLDVAGQTLGFRYN